jgi:hypothetical protein
MKEQAGKYYGRSDLSAEEKAAATKVLAEAVLEGEGKEKNAGIEWIGEVLEGIEECDGNANERKALFNRC